MTILITGSRGLIGSALSRVIPSRGFDLRATGDERGDVRDAARVAEAVAGCRGVVHLAAVSRVITGERDPDLCRATNIGGLENVIAAIEAQPQPPWLVFASSREVYGEASLPAAEDAPLAPLNVYGETKVRGEQLVAAARTRTAILRLSNVYGGLADHEDRVVPAFVRGALANRPLRVDGADHLFDFTYLDDTIAGITAAIDRIDQQLPPIHLLTGRGTTLGELAALAIELAGGGSIVAGPPRTFDVSRFVGDPSRAAQLLGWTAHTQLRDGIAAMIRRAGR